MLEHEVQYRKIAKLALTEELAESWGQFIDELMKTNDGVLDAAFFMMITRGLGSLDLISMWLHTSFQKVVKDSKNARETVKKLLREYTSQNTFLKTLGEKKDIIQALNINAFGNPKAFDTAWKSLSETLISYFTGEEFAKAFVQANNLAKCAALSIMTKFVDQFDQSIKALTGSTEYTVDLEVKNFKVMLTGYVQLLGGSIKICTFPPPLSHFDTEEDKTTYRPPEKFAEEMQKFLAEHITDIKLALQVTPSVDVSALHLGNPSYYISILKYLKPKPSYEDIFIMTHQSLLVVLSALGKEAGIHEMQRPELVSSVESMITKIKTGYKPKASLIGIDIQKSGAKILYSIPLGVHSVLFDIVCKHNNKNVSVIVRFSGENDDGRWYSMRSLIELIGAVCKVNINDVRALENGMTFAMVILPTSQLDSLEKDLGYLCKFTLRHRFDTKPLIEELKKSGVFVDFVERQIQKYGFTDLSGDQFFYNIMDSLHDDDSKKYEQEAAKLADVGIVSAHYDARNMALKMYEKIFGEEKTSERVTKTAAELITKSDTILQKVALYLYAWLVEKGNTYERATKIAGDFADSSDTGLQEAVLVLYEKLVEKGQAYEAAAKTVSKLIASSEYDVRDAGLNVYHCLFEKGQGYEEAAKIAGELVASSDSGVRFTGAALCEKLVEKGHAYEAATKVAGEFVASSDPGMRYTGQQLYGKLVEKGQAYEAAAKIAGELVANSDYSVRYTGQQLYEKLVEKGQAYEAAAKIAGELLANSDYSVRYIGVILYGKLVEKGQAYEAVAKIAGELLANSDFAVRSLGLILYEKLFDKEQGYAEAAKIAGELIVSSDYNMRYIGQQLYEKLFEKGQGYAEAAKIAGELIVSSDSGMRYTGQQLYEKLFKKGQGLEQAEKIFKTLSSSSNGWLELKLLLATHPGTLVAP